MNKALLEEKVRKWQQSRIAELNDWLTRPCVTMCIAASTEVSPRWLTECQAQRAYLFTASPLAKVGNTGNKRLSALWSESMVRNISGLSFNAILLAEGNLESGHGLWSAPSLLREKDEPEVEFQFEMNASESQDLFSYIRWLGSARPAYDWLGDRAVGSPPKKALPPPRMRRLKPINSSLEMMKNTMDCIQEAQHSVWLTASTLQSKGFAQEIVNLTKEKNLSVRCMIGDLAAAKEIAINQTNWQVLHCPGLSGNTVLIDAETEPVAIIVSHNWLGIPSEKIYGLSLSLMVDDPRLNKLIQFWKEFSPLCNHIKT